MLSDMHSLKLFRVSKISIEEQSILDTNGYIFIYLEIISTFEARKIEYLMTFSIMPAHKFFS